METKGLLFEAPKLYHIILGRVKHFQITLQKICYKIFVDNKKFRRIINSMNRQTQFYVDMQTDKVWESISESYPKLIRFNPPKIKLCNRLYRTAGKCYQEENLIHLANKFFVNNSAEMFRVILPHEIAHQADFVLFGESEKKCGHGIQWEKIMLQLGLPVNKYHSMTL